MLKEEELLRLALEEDIGKGDITTELILKGEEEKRCRASIITKEGGKLAGIHIAKKVFNLIDEDIKFEIEKKDGSIIKEGETIAKLYGRAKSILMGERVALNFLTRLSGIATLTYQFVKKLKNDKIYIMDTRKTTPLMRRLEKYAVRIGGGKNHRYTLWDSILIKDNHIKVAGGVKEAIEKIKSRIKNYKNRQIEIEINKENLKKLDEAIEANVAIIMLDNLSLSDLSFAINKIKKAKKSILIELSGGVNLNNIEELSKLDIDFISIGMLTHSAKALDISLKIDLIF